MARRADLISDIPVGIWSCTTFSHSFQCGMLCARALSPRAGAATGGPRPPFASPADPPVSPVASTHSALLPTACCTSTAARGPHLDSCDLDLDLDQFNDTRLQPHGNSSIHLRTGNAVEPSEVHSAANTEPQCQSHLLYDCEHQATTSRGWTLSPDQHLYHPSQRCLAPELALPSASQAQLSMLPHSDSNRCLFLPAFIDWHRDRTLYL